MPKQGKHIDQDIEPDVIFNGRDALRGKYRRIYAACIFKMKKSEVGIITTLDQAVRNKFHPINWRCGRTKCPKTAFSPERLGYGGHLSDIR